MHYLWAGAHGIGTILHNGLDKPVSKVSRSSGDSQHEKQCRPPQDRALISSNKFPSMRHELIHEPQLRASDSQELKSRCCLYRRVRCLCDRVDCMISAETSYVKLLHLEHYLPPSPRPLGSGRLEDIRRDWNLNDKAMEIYLNSRSRK